MISSNVLDRGIEAKSGIQVSQCGSAIFLSRYKVSIYYRNSVLKTSYASVHLRCNFALKRWDGAFPNEMEWWPRYLLLT